MPSTFTPNKSIEQPVSGSYNNAWAAPVNANWEDIDNALGGNSSINVTGVSAGTYGLILAQYQPPNISFIGTLTANLIYALPAGVGALWSIFNNTTGAFSITFGVSGGGSFVLPQGQRSHIVCDGTNVGLAQSPQIIPAPILFTAVKPADTTRTSTNALTADPDLTLSLISGKSYKVRITALITGGAGGISIGIGTTATLINSLQFPIGGYLNGTIINSVPPAGLGGNNAIVGGPIGNAGFDYIIMEGNFTPTTSGNIYLVWSQVSINVAGTTVREGSSLELVQLN